MSFRISFQNSVGELDHRICSTQEEAAENAVDMIQDAGELHAGDKIEITEIEGDIAIEKRQDQRQDRT